MCIGPLAAIPFGSILAGVGAVVSAAGTMAAANSQAAAATYRSKQEAMLAEDSLKRGAQAEEAQRRKQAALAGRQRAVLSASNVDLGSGSPLQILGDTAQLGELDASIIRDNAKREANYHTANADLGAMEAKSAKQAGAFGAFSTLLGGASSLASSWYKPAPQANSTWASANRGYA